MKNSAKIFLIGAALAIVYKVVRGSGSPLSFQADGISLNNPGKLPVDTDSQPWPNEIRPSSSSRFAQFPQPVWGLYALARTLSDILARPGDRTLTRVISEWAQARDANPTNYVEVIAQRTGLQTGANIEARMPDIMKAIIDYENGEQPYDNLLVVNSWRMTQVSSW